MEGLRKSSLIFVIFSVAFFLISGCEKKGPESTGDGTVTIVFKHGKVPGDPEHMKRLLKRFEKENPGIKVNDETLPSSTDEQHQFYVINLEAGSSDFDVISMDVIWVPEFARAGWLRDVSNLMSEEKRSDTFPGPLEAMSFKGRLFALPWYIDAGLLYYRKDLLEELGVGPPETWHKLIEIAQAMKKTKHSLYGFIWQGKQYEGLVCNVLEYLWSNGGDVFKDGMVALDSPQNVEALTFMRDLIVKYGVSPTLLTTAVEESTRHIFGNGKAVFMRNWPYAWNSFDSDGSLIKGKVGVAPLPAFFGKASSSTLGGWQLGINRYTRHPEAAERLLSFLTSKKTQKYLALTVGYKPTLRSLYSDKDLMQQQPFMTGLHDIFMKARPRPVSPYYMMITQVLQPEFSSAISGIKTPASALASAQRQVERILGTNQ
jgi:multiple sugar transport system substrate-binding protein